MKRKKKSLLKNPVLLLALSALLLSFATVGSARAALTYYSENYAAEVTVSNIGVTLLENGNDIAHRDYLHRGDEWDEAKGALFAGLLLEGEKFEPGKEYEERLAVKNSGTIDTYVRVILKKSWMDEKGKNTSLSPELIGLHLTGNGWIVDEKASTRERMVLYYAKILAAGEQTSDIIDTLCVDSSLMGKVTETVTEQGGYKTITTDYAYNGYRFWVEAEADAVQTHNAKEAIKSAWGVDVEIAADKSLRLK